MKHEHAIRSHPLRNSVRRRLAVPAAAVVFFAGTAMAANAAVITTPDAMQLAEAMDSGSVPLTGADFVTRPPSGTPTAIGDTPLAGFPTHGPTYAILSSGNADNADHAGDESGVSVDDGGGHVHGNTDYDVTTLHVNFTVPASLNCLHFDFKFLSVEWPIYVGTAYNDAFIAELDHDTWTTSGSTISAPGNFAFDQDERPVTINTSGQESMKPQYAAGTAYNAATPDLIAGTLVSPGAHSVYFSVFDQGDPILDSAAFLDNLALSYAPTPADCPSGSVVKSTNLSLTPEHAVNQVGGTHTVTADLTNAETDAPVSGAPVIFDVTGANPTTGTVITDASGRASFSYAGKNPGEDVITACYDINKNGVCNPPDEETVSVLKYWDPGPPPDLSLTPATATNDVGVTHTVTAHLTTGAGTPISGGHLLFTVTGVNELTGAATTSAAGDATFSYRGASDGDDQITACYDANDNGTCDPDEVTATAAKTWDVTAPVLSLVPRDSVHPVGVDHRVDATLTNHGSPVADARVLFRVTGANHASGEALTNDDGVATFDYVGLHPGHDDITACYDDDGDTCPGDPPASAARTRASVAPAADPVVTSTAASEWTQTAVRLSPASAVDVTGGDHTVTARLIDAASGKPVSGGFIVFIVDGANHAFGEAYTGADGTASFTYRGRAAGTDKITACDDIDADRKCTSDDPAATATKRWLPEVPVTG